MLKRIDTLRSNFGMNDNGGLKGSFLVVSRFACLGLNLLYESPVPDIPTVDLVPFP